MSLEGAQGACWLLVARRCSWASPGQLNKKRTAKVTTKTGILGRSLFLHLAAQCGQEQGTQARAIPALLCAWGRRPCKTNNAADAACAAFARSPPTKAAAAGVGSRGQYPRGLQKDAPEKTRRLKVICKNKDNRIKCECDFYKVQ